MSINYPYQDKSAKILKEIESLEKITGDENIAGFKSKLKKLRDQMGKLNLFADKGNAANDSIVNTVVAELKFITRDIEAVRVKETKKGMKIVSGVNEGVDNKTINIQRGKEIIEKNVKFMGIRKNSMDAVHGNKNSNNK